MPFDILKYNIISFAWTVFCFFQIEQSWWLNIMVFFFFIHFYTNVHTYLYNQTITPTDIFQSRRKKKYYFMLLGFSPQIFINQITQHFKLKLTSLAVSYQLFFFLFIITKQSTFFLSQDQKTEKIIHIRWEVQEVTDTASYYQTCLFLHNIKNFLAAHLKHVFNASSHCFTWGDRKPFRFQPVKIDVCWALW